MLFHHLFLIGKPFKPAPFAYQKPDCLIVKSNNLHRSLTSGNVAVAIGAIWHCLLKEADMSSLAITKVRSRIQLPWVTIIVIAICVVLLPWGPFIPLKPATVWAALNGHHEALPLALLSAVLYVFQHSRALHFVENFLVFGFLGAYVEIAVGSGSYLKYLVATAIGAAAIFSLTSSIPTVGLSGVIYGLWLTVLLAAPMTELGVITVPAWRGGKRNSEGYKITIKLYAIALLVFASQVVTYLNNFMEHHPDRNAYTLHIGSAAMGALLYLLWLKPKFAAFAKTELGAVMMSLDKRS